MISTTVNRINYGAGQTPVTVNVTTSSTQLLANNVSRRWCLITNIGKQDVYLALGQTAEVKKGILLGKQGGSILLGNDFTSGEAINAIAKEEDSDIILQEGL